MLIDVSSDNVTQPTAEMRAAMAQAEVRGYHHPVDAALDRLEGLAARCLGKEAAVLMPTGTMANLVAILCQARRGEEVLLGADSHIYDQELGGAGFIAGVMLSTWPCTGQPTAEALQETILPRHHFASSASPKSALVCLENTHNASGGTLLSAEEMEGLSSIARRSGLRVHLDGARIFNAAAALGTAAAALAHAADTVAFSLDKCLSAPYGAILCGPKEIMAHATVLRRMLGGHVRKVGIMAAAGALALENLVERVGEDNARAASLGHRLRRIRGLVVDPYPVPSNLVMLDTSGLRVPAKQVVDRMERSYGVRAHVYGRDRVRLAIHRHIGQVEEEAILSAVEKLAAEILG